MKTRIILGIIVGIIMGIIAYFQFQKFEKESNELFLKMYKEYPMLLITDSIKSRVIEIDRSYDEHSVYFTRTNVKFADKKCYTIFVDECLENPKLLLADVLKVGSFLVKNTGSDTLKITNDKIVYHFVIIERDSPFNKID